MTIAELKASVDIVAVIQSSGVELRKVGSRWKAHCPFHEERTASFFVYPATQTFCCHGGCGKDGQGDVIDYVQKRYAITREDARRTLEQDKGLPGLWVKHGSKAKPQKQVACEPINWDAFRARVLGGHIRKLHTWRGYSLAFCQWLASEELFGIYRDCFAFPVFNTLGDVISAHVKGRHWFYWPKERPVYPWVIQCEWRVTSSPAIACHIFESEWDMLAAMDAHNQHECLDATWICTRGSANAAKLAAVGALPSIRYLWPQNDEAGEKWLADVLRAIGPGDNRVVRLPLKIKDANELHRQKLCLVHCGREFWKPAP